MGSSQSRICASRFFLCRSRTASSRTQHHVNQERSPASSIRSDEFDENTEVIVYDTAIPRIDKVSKEEIENEPDPNRYVRYPLEERGDWVEVRLPPVPGTSRPYQLTTIDLRKLGLFKKRQQGKIPYIYVTTSVADTSQHAIVAGPSSQSSMPAGQISGTSAAPSSGHRFDQAAPDPPNRVTASKPPTQPPIPQSPPPLLPEASSLPGQTNPPPRQKADQANLLGTRPVAQAHAPLPQQAYQHHPSSLQQADQPLPLYPPPSAPTPTPAGPDPQSEHAPLAPSAPTTPPTLPPATATQQTSPGVGSEKLEKKTKHVSLTANLASAIWKLFKRRPWR